MIDNLAAIPPLRTLRRRVVTSALGLAIGLAVAGGAGVLAGPGRTLVERCAAAARSAGHDPARQPRVAAVCFAGFVASLDPATGARAARALARVPGQRILVERIASAIGDRAGGTDAWLAVGNARLASDDQSGAVDAYQRALDHRDPQDRAGAIHDTNGLLKAYRLLGDYEHAARAGAAAHELVARGAASPERRMTLVNIAGFLLEAGNVETAKRLLDEAIVMTPPYEPIYATVQDLLGLVEQGRGHRLAARRALLAARDATPPGAENTWPIHVALLDLALAYDQLDEAAELIAHAPPTPDAANDRALAAYYEAKLRLQQGRAHEAVAISQRARAAAPTGCNPLLDGVLGQALQRTGAVREAEATLLQAVGCIEEGRGKIENDTLKSWNLAQQRAAFEDLFLLYAGQHRFRDALMTIERATARSVLDGLVAPATGVRAIGEDIAGAGARAEARRSIARSLRESPSTAVPPIESILSGLRGHHVVTYFRARRELWAVAIMRTGALVGRKLGSLAEVQALVDRWIAHPEDHAVAEELGSRLLPDDLMPASGEPLHVIAEGPVREVTFASLRRHGAYVVERNPVGYGLSAASLSLPPRAAGTEPAVVIGDPLGDLGGARLEAIDVARWLGVTPYLRSAATSTVVLAAAHAWLLHIAAHTDPTTQGPAIHLADRPLDAALVLEHPITSRLVMLLGCSSARGADRDELGTLAAAFIAAGAQTVVASLWALDDSFAQRFARELYAMGGTTDAIRALAMVQRQMLRDGVPVTQWSTLVVLGGLSVNTKDMIRDDHQTRQ